MKTVELLVNFKLLFSTLVLKQIDLSFVERMHDPMIAIQHVTKPDTKHSIFVLLNFGSKCANF